jgi:hypothetical protein
MPIPVHLQSSSSHANIYNDLCDRFDRHVDPNAPIQRGELRSLGVTEQDNFSVCLRARRDHVGMEAS